MSVYYKFKSAKDFDSIPIEGQFVSVAHLKERIFESKQLGRGTDFDLVVSNAQTDEEYADEAAMIPKNTSVLIRRVPGRRRMPIIAEQLEPKAVEEKVEEITPPSNNTFVGDSSTMRYPEESEYDVFGNDLYAMPETVPAKPCIPAVNDSLVSKVDEDSKIRELIDSSGLDWNRPMQDAYGTGRGFGRGMGGRMMGGRGGRGFGFGRGGLQGNTPGPGYICHRCKVPGHFIQHCPTNGDPNYDVRRVKPPTGIPRSMLMATPDGSYALPSGAVAVLKPNEAAFEKEIEGLPTSRPVSDLPQELRCSLCKQVMKDAVLTSKCCFRTFCYKCIQDYITTKSMCVCGVTNVLADDLVPNYTLRETISRLLEAPTSSTENAGSFVQAQDMESARHGPPKVPSPTLSATSKEGARQLSKEYNLDTKEIERTGGGTPANTVTNSVDKKSVQNADPSEATHESASAKDAISADGAPAPEEVQEKSQAGDQGKKKKKKKTRVPVSGAPPDMQWRGYQDFGTENYPAMPVGPSAFNPYWANGGMPMGMEGYMAPYGGGMPYMNYTPGPFDVPYGGMLPQDPYAAQSYMMHQGIPQRDLSELGTGNMGMGMGMPMNQGPPIMSREEFEARKADLRRKREMERLKERDRSRDRGDRGREVSNNRDGSPVKAKPRLMSQAAPVDRPERERPVRHDRPEKDRSDRGERERSDRQDRFEKNRSERDRAEKDRPDHIEADRSEKPRPEKHRPDRSEKDRPVSSESVRHASPRLIKPRAPEPDDAAATAAAAAAAIAERKSKGSVFSRISFPGSDEGGSKKRKSEQPNGTKEREEVPVHRAVSNGHREERKISKTSTSAALPGARKDESTDEDEEYHFKRRPSRRDAAEREDDGRGKREHGHGHERPAKRR